MEGLKSVRKIIIAVCMVLASILFFSLTSSEIIIHNDEPLDLSKASVTDIQSKKLVDAKIDYVIGYFAYKEKSQEYYYLIPMDNGKFIIFCTGDKEQRQTLDRFLDSYNPIPMGLEIKGRISSLTTEEERVFFDSIVESGLVASQEEAYQYIVPYKITNDNSFLPWIYLAVAIILALMAVGFIISFIKNIRNRKNYIVAEPMNSSSEYYTGYDQSSMDYGYNQENNTSNNQGYNGGEYYTGYNSGEQYTGYSQGDNDTGYNGGEQYTGYNQGNKQYTGYNQNSQSNNSESNIHKF